MADDELTAQAGNDSEATASQVAGDDFDKDRAMATIKKLRDFEKMAKGELKELEVLRAKVKASEEANLTETQRLQRQLEETSKALADREAAIKERDAKLAETQRASKVLSIAASLGAADPSDPNFVLAVQGIDPNDPKADQLISDKLKALAEARPYLFKQGQTGGPLPSGNNLTPFNPAAMGGEAMTDQQRIRQLMARTGQGSYGPLG